MEVPAPDTAPGHDDVERILAPNPGPMTLDGTNTYVIGTAEGAFVIDPGPDDESHLAAVSAAAERHGGVRGVLLTHSHSDHSAGAGILDAPVLWGDVSAGDEASVVAGLIRAGGAEGGTPAVRPQAQTEDGGGGSRRQDPPATRVGPFDVIPTPGHAADHVCFVLGRVCFCGDLVLGRGSTIVPPRAGGGSLADYMTSLERLADLDAVLLAPGHGPWIAEPAPRIAEYAEHRRDRERRLIAALGAGERSRAALLAAVWDDVPAPLRPAAAIAMEAHIEKLEDEGRMDGIELGA